MQLKQLTTTGKTDVEMNDTISISDDDEFQVDTELTKADNTPDTIISSSDDSESVAKIRSSGDDIYDYIEKRLLSLDPEMTMALGRLTYHTDFHPHYFPPEKEGGFRKTLYKRTLTDGKDEANELGLVFFGEICSSVYGTAITAKGNHYVGSPKFPKVRFTQF
jgi:hypothetical protein